jgi:hypothetical protein
MKKYTLIFEDVQGNEIDKKEVWELNKKEAKERARLEKSVSMLNNLKKVTVL